MRSRLGNSCCRFRKTISFINRRSAIILRIGGRFFSILLWRSRSSYGIAGSLIFPTNVITSATRRRVKFDLHNGNKH